MIKRDLEDIHNLEKIFKNEKISVNEADSFEIFYITEEDLTFSEHALIPSKGSLECTNPKVQFKLKTVNHPLLKGLFVTS